jgi:hypothetical protein
MKMKSKLSFAIVSMCLVNSVFAVPTIYPTNITRLSELQNNTNSNIVADNSDDRVLWVMPPSSGSSEVKGLHTFTTNVGFCKEMSLLQGYSRDTAARIDSLTDKEIDSKEELDEKTKEYNNAKKDLAALIDSKNLTELDYTETRIETLETHISHLTDKLGSCADQCDEILNQLNTNKKEKREEVKRHRNLVIQIGSAARAYEKQKALVLGLGAEVDDLESSWSKLRDVLLGIKKIHLDLYKDFGKMEGARASIFFDSKWDENVKTLRDSNPGFTFHKIQTQNAVVTAGIVDIQGLPESGAVMRYSMDGNFQEGKLTLPSYPESTSGLVLLSLIGACPVLHPDYFDITLPAGSDQMKYGMTVSYEYPTAFFTKATAKYNMHRMYEKIVKSGSKGGFFRPKSWTAVSEKLEFSDSFNVKWEEQDVANSLTEEEKAVYELEMRNRVFGRIASLALPSVQNPGALISAEVPASGAVVLGEELGKNKACQANIYCTSAAIGMKVLAAIFGNSSSTASYTNIQDVESQDIYEKQKVVFKPWISSYK